MTNPPDPGDRPADAPTDEPATGPADEPTAEQNEPTSPAAAEAAPTPPAPAPPAPTPPAPPPWYGYPQQSPYPFTPTLREPWVNPAKRTGLMLGAIVAALVLLAGGFGIGVAVGDNGPGDRHRDGRGERFPGHHAQVFPNGPGYRMLPVGPDRQGRQPGRRQAPRQPGPTPGPTGTAPSSATG